MDIIEKILNTTVSAIFKLWPQAVPSAHLLKNAKIVAHRGAHESKEIKENTLPAFDLCVQNHIWAIELDVRFTADSMPVIHHDPHCGRLWNRADIVIENLKFSELRKNIPMIPTLPEIISRYKSKIHLMIEVKEQLSGRPDCVIQLEKALSEIKPVEDYHLISLHPEFLESIQSVPKAAFIDIIWINPTEIFKKNELFRHGGVAGHFLFLSSKNAKTLKAQGKSVSVGFLDSKNSLYRELNRGIDYIFTDHPLLLRKIITQALDHNPSKR